MCVTGDKYTPITHTCAYRTWCEHVLHSHVMLVHTEHDASMYVEHAIIHSRHKTRTLYPVHIHRTTDTTPQPTQLLAGGPADATGRARARMCWQHITIGVGGRSGWMHPRTTSDIVNSTWPTVGRKSRTSMPTMSSMPRFNARYIGVIRRGKLENMCVERPG